MFLLLSHIISVLVYLIPFNSSFSYLIIKLMYYSVPGMDGWWGELCFCDEGRTVKAGLYATSRIMYCKSRGWSYYKGNRTQFSGAAVNPCLCCRTLWLCWSAPCVQNCTEIITNLLQKDMMDPFNKGTTLHKH